MNRKIISYDILTDEVMDIEVSVNEAIADGWQPYGSPFWDGDSRDPYLCQAVVKYAK